MILYFFYQEMQQILFKVIKRKLATRGTLLWLYFIKGNLVTTSIISGQTRMRVDEKIVNMAN